EATGLADPLELIDQVTKEDVLPFVRLASLIAVLDPVNFAHLAEELHSGIRQQTELADFILLNKRDLADEHALQDLIARVRELNPRAQVFLTEHGVMDYDFVLDREGEISRPTARPRQAQVHDHFHTLTVLCPVP